MEFVAGEPIDEATQDLPLRERIELFLQLADAVAHAHQKLFVHRDIKPSNVLVDAARQVKLLDFGIAKALDPLLARGEATVWEQRPFTPAYASPEQIRGEPVSTLSDVYSLGVLLYRLLLREAPYGRGADTAAEQALATLEEHPDVTPLPPDLAQVVAEALRKPPDERYPSVETLADDLRRYLGGYPVRARPASGALQAWKFVKRNPWPSGLSALLLCSVLGGASAALWQARKAEQRLAALQSITGQTVFKFGDAVTYVPGGMAIKADLLSQSVEVLDELTAVAADDAATRAQAAMAYARLADIEFNDTSASLQRREQAQAHSAKALVLGASVIEGKLGDAEFVTWYVRAVESKARGDRAQGRVADGLARLEPVLPLLERALQAVPAGGEDLRQIGLEQARALHLRSQFLYKPGSNHLNRPDDALHDLAAARQQLRRLETEKHHAELLYVLGSVDGAEALVLGGLDRVPDAVRLAQEALAESEAVVRELPDDVEYRDALVTEAVNLGKMLLRLPDPAAALTATRRGWDMNQVLLKAAWPGPHRQLGASPARAGALACPRSDGQRPDRRSAGSRGRGAASFDDGRPAPSPRHPARRVGPQVLTPRESGGGR